MFKKKDKKIESEKSKKSKLRENIETIISAIIIALLIRIFLIEAYQIPTESMVPTLIVRDHLLVNKFIYGVRIPVLGWKLPKISSPKRGDILVFHYPKYKSPGWTYELVDLITFGIFNLTNTSDDPKNFIKRTIGIPGDIFSFKNQKIFINGKELKQKNKIKSSLSEKVLSIHNPNQKTEYSSIPEGASYYSKDRKGNIKGYDGQSLLTEHIGDIEHIIQLRYSHSEYDIPFLYIPKKGDQLEVEIKPNSKNIRDIHFVVNGKFKGRLSDEHFTRFYKGILPLKKTPFKHTFEDDYYFMMGDNRDNSSDSRDWGFVNEKYIIGTPLIIYWPLKRFGTVPE